MSLQNRVDPFGNIITTRARGSWLGNRGVIHDENKQIVRTFRLKAWITCLLEFRGRHREVMQPNRWTELFFLDEATAFSAGHRPCFQCRYADHQRFKDAWLKGNPQYDLDHKTPISKIDQILHAERTAAHKPQISIAEISDLPDGTFIEITGKPYLKKAGELVLWTPFGYEKAINIDIPEHVSLLTPVSIINAFKAGYRPQTSI